MSYISIDGADVDNTETFTEGNENDSSLPTSNRRNDLGDFETLIHLLKASLGTGILAMPMAFKSAGLIFGLVGTIFIGFICTYCVEMFVRCSRILCTKHNLESVGFKQIVELSFQEGPPQLRRYSKIAGMVIVLAVSSELLGSCCAYVVFVARSLKQVVDHYGGHDLDIRFYMLALFPFLIITNLLRNLKYITPFSLISNSLFMSGVVVTYYYIFQDLPSINERNYFGSWSDLPKFFGTTIFALQGIGVMLPLEKSMKTPKNFVGVPGVLSCGMTILVVLYSVTGFSGYLKYGSKTKDSVTFNLPTGDLLAQVLNLIIAVGIFLTYSLLLYSVMDLLKDSFGDRFRDNRYESDTKTRLCLITGTVVIAALFPDLSPFLTLVGALSLSIVGLIFPPIIESLVFWQSRGTEEYRLRFSKNILIVLFGLTGLVTGTMKSLEEFAEAYKDRN